MYRYHIEHPGIPKVTSRTAWRPDRTAAAKDVYRLAGRHRVTGFVSLLHVRLPHGVVRLTLEERERGEEA